jgi:hypothetical protein
MLRRKDLLREFEEVSKQEIINHNSAILQTNMAIQELTQKDYDIEQKIISRDAAVNSHLVSLTMSIESLKGAFEVKLQNISKSIEEKEKSIDNKLKFLSLSLEEEKKKVVKKEDLEEFRQNLGIVLRGIEQRFLEERNAISRDLKPILDRFNDLVNSIKQEVVSYRVEIEKARKDMISKIDIAKVDADGIMKEISVWKKTSFIHEKQIENLYTLISRLEDRL